MGIDRIDIEGPSAKFLRERLMKKRDKVAHEAPKEEKAAKGSQVQSKAKARSARGRAAQIGKRQSILGAGGTSTRKTLGGQ